MKNDEIEFTKEKYLSLKRRYRHAVKKKLVIFEFEGKDMVTDYCCHLIEYLKTKFEPDERKDSL